MAPLEVLPETMRTVAHVSPHAWASDAFAELIRRDASVTAILPEVAVLAAMAAALLAFGTHRLRAEVLSRP